MRIVNTRLELPNCPRRSRVAGAGKSSSTKQAGGRAPSGLTGRNGPGLSHLGAPRLPERWISAPGCFLAWGPWRCRCVEPRGLCWGHPWPAFVHSTEQQPGCSCAGLTLAAGKTRFFPADWPFLPATGLAAFTSSPAKWPQAAPPPSPFSPSRCFLRDLGHFKEETPPSPPQKTTKP